MIRSFRHKGLQAFYETGSKAGILPQHAARLRELLAALDAAAGPQDLSRPSWRLHALSGDLRGLWAVTVQANWRLTFRFEGSDVELLDYLDYH
ncbi:proteic killer suppression protein [Tepidimonas ignava]|uniref:Endoribonuclease HigB n=1 Tax=Tepidimonas ignava TaxID=114249 RepID=A0A4R3L2D8_9BURK|nr:type II toxin-antitoxin system RelE/ParE family toxin [Tepidimonas ignava]TCS93723.1 proteic killer suppression protein [Tepidimonas ignava]TSE18392.1 Endoribonuclease HigB [Tepidimonas ignava]